MPRLLVSLDIDLKKTATEMGLLSAAAISWSNIKLQLCISTEGTILVDHQ